MQWKFANNAQIMLSIIIASLIMESHIINIHDKVQLDRKTASMIQSDVNIGRGWNYSSMFMHVHSYYGLQVH